MLLYSARYAERSEARKAAGEDGKGDALKTLGAAQLGAATTWSCASHAGVDDEGEAIELSEEVR